MSIQEQQRVRRVPSRRITRRLSFSSPSAKRQRTESDSPLSDSSRNSLCCLPNEDIAEDNNESAPSTPKSSRRDVSSSCGSIILRNEKRQLFSLNDSLLDTFSDEPQSTSTPVYSPKYKNIREALMKSRRRLYMEQMFKERRAIRRRNLEAQFMKAKKDQVMDRFQTLRL